MLPLKGEEHIVIPKKYYLEETISGESFFFSCRENINIGKGLPDVDGCAQRSLALQNQSS